MAPEALGTRLKSLREAKGLTKYRLAKLSGVSETYIYRIERGLIKNPRGDTSHSICPAISQ
ncbi:helix-turn-helix domain-containing protein [Candidatus Magnetobacterium casense]|uniref:helix-turn-helix domain-containing protein n=1 Tax=Candidatus Magnetobacterium casense TaxID=1455061 RepID=UPI001C45D079